MEYQNFYLDFINDVKKNMFTTDSLKRPIIHHITIDEDDEIHAALCYYGHGKDPSGNTYSNILMLIYFGELVDGEFDADMDIEIYKEVSIWFDLSDIETISEFLDMMSAYNKPLKNNIEIATSHEYGDGYVCFMGGRWDDSVELGFQAYQGNESEKYDFCSFQMNSDKFIELMRDADILIQTQMDRYEKMEDHLEIIDPGDFGPIEYILDTRKRKDPTTGFVSITEHYTVGAIVKGKKYITTQVACKDYDVSNNELMAKIDILGTMDEDYFLSDNNTLVSVDFLNKIGIKERGKN